jgi:hypothetical protein
VQQVRHTAQAVADVEQSGDQIGDARQGPALIGAVALRGGAGVQRDEQPGQLRLIQTTLGAAGTGGP